MIRIENIQGSGQPVELRKVVIKLGSAVVMGEDGSADMEALTSLMDSLVRLRAQGVDVLLVTSGAIAMGRRLYSDFAARTIPDRQALAAVGQVGLMHVYNKLLTARNLKVAQILLTRGDMADRGRYLNARYAMERLLALGAVPVINENDTVTVDELKFGDNDELSALVASKMQADLLVILSVVNGLYHGDPTRKSRGSAPAAPVPMVERVDETIEKMVDATRSGAGTGGMKTKLAAMRIAGRAGVHGIIAGGKMPGILDRIVEGRFVGTYFMPVTGRRLSGRDRWIAFGGRAKGQILIDAGAREALVVGKKSLLPAGVVGVTGDFDRGELVEIVGPGGDCLARGLASFAAGEVEKIKGKKTSQIRKILGAVDYQEIVHRDNMTMQG